MERSRVGIFGGAFNPIHTGHLFIAKEAKRIFSLSKVTFIPTGNPAFQKEGLLDKNIRTKLVELSISGNKDFDFSLYEIKKNTTSYFIETLNYFKELYPEKEFFTILGEDAFLKFHLWREPKEILKKTNLIVAKRFEDNFSDSRKYMNKYFREFKEKIFFMDHPLFPISSTLIRRRIYEGKFISYLVPNAVEKEILENGYYRKN